MIFQASIWELMGLRLEGIINALVLPLVLTMILFLGPLYQNHLAVPITYTFKVYAGE